MASSSSSDDCPDSDSEEECSFRLPKNHVFVRVLGHGAYGTVLACVNEEREEPVAIKVFKQKCIAPALWEARIMRTLMQYDLDSSNIVKYQGSYSDNKAMNLMYEMLDISLEDYMNTIGRPARLEDIRVIIQQMAVAFDALKSVGVIHGDLKLDNIMLVDHMRRPFRVKLIDFGLALYRWNATPGKLIQTIDHRAPEIMLGLPFSEAIDIWSLGCVMANLVLCVALFPGNSEYEALRVITDLLGPPPAHLLKIGKNTRVFYKKVDNQWQLKTPEEYYQLSRESERSDYWSYTGVFSLDEAKAMRLEKNNPREAEERRECIELLKAMLQWDEKDRITPGGILKHPFITKSYLNNTSDLSGPSRNEPQATTSRNQMEAGTETVDKVSETLQSGVIQVQPADPENRIHFVEEPNEDPERSSHQALPPGVILVRPADPENRIHLGEEPNEAPEPSCHEALPQGVILVQPAHPENRIHLGEEPNEALELSPHPTPAPASTDDTATNPVDTEHQTVLDDGKVPEKKKKKKKNCFKRFFSWVKRTFSCRVGPME